MTDINKKSSMYVIERGIPAPCNRNVGRWATIVSEMNDGDSVVVADLKETHSMRSAIVRNGKRSSVQQLPDGNFRVWKLPKRQMNVPRSGISIAQDTVSRLGLCALN